jgi:hypothetical protein
VVIVRSHDLSFLSQHSVCKFFSLAFFSQPFPDAINSATKIAMPSAIAAFASRISLATALSAICSILFSASLTLFVFVLVADEKAK